MLRDYEGPNNPRPSLNRIVRGEFNRGVRWLEGWRESIAYGRLLRSKTSIESVTKVIGDRPEIAEGLQFVSKIDDKTDLSLTFGDWGYSWQIESRMPDGISYWTFSFPEATPRNFHARYQEFGSEGMYGESIHENTAARRSFSVDKDATNPEFRALVRQLEHEVMHSDAVDLIVS